MCPHWVLTKFKSLSPFPPQLQQDCAVLVGEILDNAPTVFQFVLYMILEVKQMRTNNGKLLST